MKTGGDNCTLSSKEIEFETEELLVGSKVCVKMISKYCMMVCWVITVLHWYCKGPIACHQILLKTALILLTVNAYLLY